MSFLLRIVNAFRRGSKPGRQAQIDILDDASTPTGPAAPTPGETPCAPVEAATPRLGGSTSGVAPPAAPAVGHTRRRSDRKAIAFEVDLESGKESSVSAVPKRPLQSRRGKRGRTSEETALSSSAPSAAGVPDMARMDDADRVALLESAKGPADTLFGAAVVANLTSSIWQDRKAALDTLAVQLRGAAKRRRGAGDASASDVDPTALVSASAPFIAHSCSHGVGPVYFSALECVGALMSGVVPLGVAPTCRANVALIVPPLLERMASANLRFRKEAGKAVASLTASPAPLGCALMSPFVSDVRFPIRARLVLLRACIKEGRFAKSSRLSVSVAMSTAVPALQIADDKTRKSAVMAISTAYQVSGSRIERHLVGVKPAMLAVLRREFAKVDGRQDATEGTQPTGLTPAMRNAQLRPLKTGSSLSGPPTRMNPSALPPLSSSVKPRMTGASESIFNLAARANAENPNSGSRPASGQSKSIHSLDVGDEALMAEILDQRV